jgi:hypothetical protein
VAEQCAVVAPNQGSREARSIADIQSHSVQGAEAGLDCHNVGGVEEGFPIGLNPVTDRGGKQGMNEPIGSDFASADVRAALAGNAMAFSERKVIDRPPGVACGVDRAGRARAQASGVIGVCMRKEYGVRPYAECSSAPIRAAIDH